MIRTAPQLLMFTGTGATKSLTSAPNDAEARLFRNALPNASHVPAGKTPAAVRLLTAPIEFVPFRVRWLPQHGKLLLEKHWLVGPVVTHRSRPRVGVPPPLVKSKMTSRSPAVRLMVCAPGVPRPGVVAWLISKSMFAEPRLLVRSHARYKKSLPLANSDAS